MAPGRGDTVARFTGWVTSGHHSEVRTEVALQVQPLRRPP
jgi:hypothetical protein